MSVEPRLTATERDVEEAALFPMIVVPAVVPLLQLESMYDAWPSALSTKPQKNKANKNFNLNIEIKPNNYNTGQPRNFTISRISKFVVIDLEGSQYFVYIILVDVVQILMLQIIIAYSIIQLIGYNVINYTDRYRTTWTTAAGALKSNNLNCALSPAAAEESLGVNPGIPCTFNYS
jgi:hypothetical protein